MTTDDRLIVDELVKIRDMADKLIATMNCPERNAPPIDVPVGDCASSRCRCNPENVKSGTAVPKRKPGYPTECPACCSENIVKQFDRVYYCVPCGNTFIDT